MDQQSPTANILMYVKFGVNGVIDTVESVDMDSPTKRIAYKLNYGSFHLHAEVHSQQFLNHFLI